MQNHIDELDTPFLWVDLNLLENNISNLSSYFSNHGVNWRPHTKGIKIPEIAKMLISAGAIGITCAKLSEAEVMAQSGINQVLIANQVVGTNKIERLAQLAKKIELLVAVDDEKIIVEMNQAAKKNKIKLLALVEMNVGMDRAGVPPGYKTLELSKKIMQMPWLSFQGIMVWEGHAAGIIDFQEKKDIISESMRALNKTIKLFEEKGIPLKIISGAGSATYQISTGYSTYNEIQVGGAVFTDHIKLGGFQRNPPCMCVVQLPADPQKKELLLMQDSKPCLGGSSILYR